MCLRSYALITRYASRWNWKSLSGNAGIPWTEQLIEEFSECWDWSELSNNAALPWTLTLIERYESRWQWNASKGNSKCLSRCEFAWSPNILFRFKSKLNLVRQSKNKSLDWSQELFATLSDCWDAESVAAHQDFEVSQMLVQDVERLLDRNDISDVVNFGTDLVTAVLQIVRDTLARLKFSRDSFAFR